MHPRNELLSLRQRLQIVLVSLLTVCLLPQDSAAGADDFDPVRGKRVLGAAMENSATGTR